MKLSFSDFLLGSPKTLLAHPLRRASDAQHRIPDDVLFEIMHYLSTKDILSLVLIVGLFTARSLFRVSPATEIVPPCPRYAHQQTIQFRGTENKRAMQGNTCHASGQPAS